MFLGYPIYTVHAADNDTHSALQKHVSISNSGTMTIFISSLQAIGGHGCQVKKHQAT